MSASTAAVMPTNHLPGDAGNPGTGVTALPLTTNMTASSLTSGGRACLDEQIERLKRCEYLREGEVKALCLRAREILVDESNVQRVDAPVTVCKSMAPARFGLHSEPIILLLDCFCIFVFRQTNYFSVFSRRRAILE